MIVYFLGRSCETIRLFTATSISMEWLAWFQGNIRIKIKLGVHIYNYFLAAMIVCNSSDGGRNVLQT